LLLLIADALLLIPADLLLLISDLLLLISNALLLLIPACAAAGRLLLRLGRLAEALAAPRACLALLIPAASARQRVGLRSTATELLLERRGGRLGLARCRPAAEVVPLSGGVGGACLAVAARLVGFPRLSDPVAADVDGAVLDLDLVAAGPVVGVLVVP